MNNISDFQAHKRDEEFDAAEDRRKERKTMSYSRTIILSKDDIEALSYALDLAHDDQEQCLDTGSPSIDYGEEWPSVSQNKARMFRLIGSLADRAGIHGEKDRWETLAANYIYPAILDKPIS